MLPSPDGLGLHLGVWNKIEKKVGPVANNLSVTGLTDLAETHVTLEEQINQDRAQRVRKTSRPQTRYWRRVPSISVLPTEKNQLPANFLLRGVMVVAIVMLVLLASARYLDWNDSEVLTQATETRSQSVKLQLTARQNEIEPLQSQISLLSSELESAETTYRLATEGQTDWFAAMSRLFSISVSGVDFLSAAVNSEGRVTLVGVATDPDAITSLPNQLSQLAGVVNLQGIQWDADVSPPVFTAGFQVSR